MADRLTIAAEEGSAAGPVRPPHGREGEGDPRALVARLFGDACWTLSEAGGGIVDASPAFARLSGYAPAEAIGRDLRFLQRDDTDPAAEEALRAALREGRPCTVVVRCYRRDGTRFLDEQQHYPLRDGAGRITHVVTLQRDVTAERGGRGGLAPLDDVDALTGLPGERAFRERVAQAAGSAEGVAVALVDLDDFGFARATLAGAGARRLVRELAARLRRAVARGETVARLGEDRFGLLLGGVDAPEALAPRLRDLHARVTARVRLGSCEARLSATSGVALLGGPPARTGEAATRRASAALDAAERALARAKRDDRGRWRLADPAHDARLRAREAAEAELRAALERDELVLHYQPRVDLHRGGLAGVEALVRWLHPERGLLAPQAFLPQLEAAGLDPHLFRWVLRRALEQAAAWRDAGRPCRVAVNVGRPTLEHPGFEGWVRGELERRDLNPALLELELTEGTPMEVFEGRAPALASLRASGVRLALDDFGVATASLSQLQRLPLDALKIDRHFVGRLVAGTRGDLEMLRAIVAIGKSLDLTVVAEGVETEAQRRVLTELRCDEGQGFLYSRAVPAERVPFGAAALGA